VTDGSTVKKINKRGIITIIAGNGISGFSGDSGLAIKAKLNCPNDVAVDFNGNVYISDGSNNRIRKVDMNGIINSMAGMYILRFANGAVKKIIKN
jgi:hypothetical protein